MAFGDSNKLKALALFGLERTDHFSPGGGFSIFKIKTPVLMILFLLLASRVASGQEQSNTHLPNDMRHFISTNPIKPIIGLLNVHYEYQVWQGFGITAFSEVLAIEVIKDFDHPDMVSTLGVSLYPLLGDKEINQALFVNLNTSYIQYFRDDVKFNSFANGAQVGYKWLLDSNKFLEPKVLINYVYQENSVLPGFELLLGLRF
jgi:hypothetical protein